MEKPVLSPNFTIEDIHMLRQYHYEMTKHMTDEERMDYYNKRGRENESLIIISVPQNKLAIYGISLTAIYRTCGCPSTGTIQNPFPSNLPFRGVAS